MRKFVSIIIAVVFVAFSASADVSTRKERKAVEAGNVAYRAKDYSKALTQYKIALRDNPSSLVARFNSALAMVQIANAMDPKKEKEKADMLEQAQQAFSDVAAHYNDNPMLASRANYNLGNISYLAKDYQSAVDFYKQALRLNPNDDRARKNLRLAQMKLPKDKKDQDKKDKDKDKKDKKPDQDKKKPKDDKKDQDKKDKPENNKSQQPQQPRQGGMSPQAADRILKRSSDKEKETLKKAMYGRERNSPASRKRW